MSSFDCTNSVFNLTTETNSFSVTIPRHWESTSAEKTIDELNILLELRSLELHVKEVRKRGSTIKLGDNEYKLSDLDSQKNEILEEVKNAKYNDLEDLVYRFQLTFDEIICILDSKYIPTKRTGQPLNPGFYEVIDLNNTSKYVSPDKVKVFVIIDDIRLKPNLNFNRTLIFTEKSFFRTILEFAR